MSIARWRPTTCITMGIVRVVAWSSPVKVTVPITVWLIFSIDAVLSAFDPFLYVRLTPNSVRKSESLSDAYNVYECAYRCANERDFTCLAFDWEELDTGAVCHLAGTDFEVESTEDVSILNFQIEKMPCKYLNYLNLLQIIIYHMYRSTLSQKCLVVLTTFPSNKISLVSVVNFDLC